MSIDKEGPSAWDYVTKNYYTPRKVPEFQPQDMVDKPSHYIIKDDKGEEIAQVRDVQRSVSKRLSGIMASDMNNAIKYLLRSPFKGKMLQDLKKCHKHTGWMIEKLESEL